MWKTKLKSAAALIAACLVLTGSGLLAVQALAKKPPVAEPTALQQAEKPGWPEARAELEKRVDKYRPTPQETLFLRIPWLSSCGGDAKYHDKVQEETDKISKAEKRPIFVFKNPAHACEAG